MGPEAPQVVKTYPLAIGLLVLLLPYLYSALVFPFSARSHFSKTPEKDELTSSSLSSIATAPSVTQSVSTAAGGFYFWGRSKQSTKPKTWENRLTRPVKHSTVQPLKSSAAPRYLFSRPIPSVSISLSTKSVTVTKAKGVKTVTRSVTQTVQVTVQKPAEPRIEEESVVIDEISVMGWHQVFSSHLSLILPSDDVYIGITGERMLFNHCRIGFSFSTLTMCL